MISELNSTATVSQQDITCHYSAGLQTVKQSLRTSKHLIAFSYSDYHFKENRDKLVLINC